MASEDEDIVNPMTKYSYGDIEPLPLDDSRAQLGQIMYSQEYRETLGILRVLLGKKEYSERALAVTEKAIDLNPAHYTVWQYRYDIIKHLTQAMASEADRTAYLDRELQLNEGMAINTPKNYQIWNYRQKLIELHPKPSSRKEYPVIEAIIIEDNKNYHTWSYRIWLVQYFGLYRDLTEINFVNALLAKDPRNNSAWSFRFFLKFNEKVKLSKAEVEDEVAYAKKFIDIAPQNPSSWNYLSGIYSKTKWDLMELEELCLQYVDLANIDSETIDSDEKEFQKVSSVPALKLLEKIYENTSKQKSFKVLDILEKVDPIRENYYIYKKSLLV